MKDGSMPRSLTKKNKIEISDFNQVIQEDSISDSLSQADDDDPRYHSDLEDEDEVKDFYGDSSGASTPLFKQKESDSGRSG